jgi:ADP-ribose pyrophosphatase YjhB (NUDIX family)
MHPFLRFKFCPACGEPRTGKPAIPFTCGGCRFVFYFSPTAAAAAIIARSDGKVLFITRAKDPAKGMLAFPGGFIDIGETAENALRRETLEEVNLEINEVRLLCSHPNEYDFKGVTYPVLDFIFSAKTDSSEAVRALDGVAEFSWRNPGEVDLDELAFPSLREGLKAYQGVSTRS